jgi:hypothetical protein
MNIKRALPILRGRTLSCGVETEFHAVAETAGAGQLQAEAVTVRRIFQMEIQAPEGHRFKVAPDVVPRQFGGQHVEPAGGPYPGRESVGDG